LISSAFFIGRASHQSIKGFITINAGSNNLRKTTLLRRVIIEWLIIHEAEILAEQEECFRYFFATNAQPP
jgi:hypothetical protein